MSGGESDDSRRMHSILELADECGLGEQIQIDPAITRGLDYYTGIVYETFLEDLPAIGSVCSGGRYNNLASLYTKAELPGVGSSIGLDRLLAALEELAGADNASGGAGNAGSAGNAGRARAADVLIFMLDEQHLAWYVGLARRFRSAGFMTEIYPSGRKLAQQFAYAEKKGIPVGIIAGEAEIEKNRLNYKDLISRESREGIDIETALTLARDRL